MKTFEFELDQRVALKRGALKRGVYEVGDVEGRAEYRESNPLYLVLYTAADGRTDSGWFHGSDLIPLA